MDAVACLNCDAPLSDPRRPLFCSERCQEEAHTVRYARRVAADGRILDPEVADALRIRVGMVLGGGYAKRERHLSPEARQAIFDRDGHACQVCGGPATQIHHRNEDLALVARDINDPDNLQAICDPCHRQATLATFRPLGPDEAEHAQRLHERIHALKPQRICDDGENWAQQWQRVAGDRRRALKARAG